MKYLSVLFILALLAGGLQAAPVTTATVNRPTTSAVVSKPTTSVAVQHPGTSAVVVHPATTAQVQRPVTSVPVLRPTTQVTVTRPGERGVAYVDQPAPAPAPSATKTQSPASSSGGSYTPSYKNAKDLKEADVPKAAQLSNAATGLGMTNSDAAQKEADAKAFQVKKAMSTQVSTEDVLKNTKLPSDIDGKLKQRNFEAAKAAGKK